MNPISSGIWALRISHKSTKFHSKKHKNKNMSLVEHLCPGEEKGCSAQDYMRIGPCRAED